MGWFKVDDQLAFNAKIITAGNTAMGLWVRAGSWSCAQLTGGFIAKAMANAMANECDADALVMAGLWKEVEGGYQFHDWDEFQPSAEAEKEKRRKTLQARSDAGKAGAEARWGKKSNSKPHGKRNGKTIANQWQNDAPDPTRPISTSKEVEARPEVEELCTKLADAVEANGAKRPTKSKASYEAARLLLDRDGYTPEQVTWMIQWATSHEFWRSNILSMAKLRDKFDQLKLQAMEGKHKPAMGKFGGDLDADAILGPDYWVVGMPPEGLTIQEELAWKKARRAEHEAERLEEARRKVASG